MGLQVAEKNITKMKTFQGLKDKPRSGRPPDVSEEKLLEVRKELSENPSGWKVKQIMNIIYERTGVNSMKFTFKTVTQVEVQT